MIDSPSVEAIHDLRSRLDDSAFPEEDVELELEMLDALEQLVATHTAATSGVLPEIPTHHRVVIGEVCHFSAPASLTTDEATTAAGRVLMTGARTVFVGAGRTSTLPWHAVHDVVRLERDVILTRRDHTPAAQYRFNTYADAVIAAYLSGHLKRRSGGRL